LVATTIFLGVSIFYEPIAKKVFPFLGNSQYSQKENGDTVIS
jgi:hypothetical protein